MRLDFSSRVVLVTGAAQGIGEATARAFIDAGATVHIADIDATSLEASSARLQCDAHVCDLSDRRSALALIDGVVAKEKRLDILILGAGGVGHRLWLALSNITEEDWSALFRANVDTAIWLVQAAAPIMQKAGWGRIITISSGSGLRPSNTGVHGYTAAKHAVVGLTRQLSSELARDGVTVNSIAPGLVLSSEAPKKQWANYSPERQARALEAIHTRRLVTAADVASATLFLASEQAASITGQVLSVDGGRS